MFISIIIPAYNEEDLIGSTVRSLIKFLLQTYDQGEVIVVDDGSTDSTVSVLNKLIEEDAGKIQIKIINNQKNRGKGYSIKQGMLQATGDVRVFTDADLPYRQEVIKEIHQIIFDGGDIVIGDRNNPRSELIKVHPIRKVAGNIYRAFVRLMITGGITDTQCGLKGFSAKAAQFIFSRTTIDGFGFDVEALRIGQKHSFSISRLPVKMVNNRSDSRVHLIRDSLLMLWNLIVIRKNEVIGLYD